MSGSRCWVASAIMRLRCGCTDDVGPTTITPPFPERANATILRSISSAVRTPIGVSSTPNEGAAVWIAAKPPEPAATAGSRITATRDIRGAISFRSSNDFPYMLNSRVEKPVALPPGRARLSTKPLTHRVDRRHEHDRHGAACLLQGGHDRARRRQDEVRRERDQFCRVFAKAVDIARTPAIVDANIAADAPAAFLQPLRERGDLGERIRIVRAPAHEHADAPHPFALLRARRERPGSRRAAEQRDELAALYCCGHSITSSAATSRPGGTVRPSVFAVFRLTTVSNLVAACTGRSAGLSPRRMRST